MPTLTALGTALCALYRCGRTFFPDRLPKHIRVCKAREAKEGSSGIRPTMTDGATITRGAY